MNKKIILYITLSLFCSFMNISASVPSDSDVVTAINQGNTSKLTELLSAGANPNATYNGTPAILLAAVYNNLDMMKSLLEHGANVDAKNAAGTSLYFAVSESNPQMVKLLVDYGANIHATGAMGQTPESIARALKNNDVLRALYSKNSVVSSNNTPNLLINADKSHTMLSTLSEADMLEAKNTAETLDKISNPNERVAYFLGKKNYSMSSAHAPQRVQLITPYSLLRNAYYVTNKNFSEPQQSTIDTIKKFDNIAWVWVWSQGAYDYLSYNPAPAITNVVIKDSNGQIHKSLDRDIYTPYNLMLASGITIGTLWPFPIDVFVEDNLPMEIILVDTEMHQKPLKVTFDKMNKIK